MSVEEALAGRLAHFCCGQTKGDTYEIVNYGLELIIETVCKCACLLLFAAAIHKLPEGITFLLCFCPLRARMGGIHCRTNVGCTGVMFLLLFAALFLAKFSVPRVVPVLLFLACMAVCLLFAPSTGETNPITDPKIRRRKKCGAVVILTLLLVAAQIPVFAFAVPGICVSFVAETISVLLQEREKYRLQMKKKSENPA